MKYYCYIVTVPGFSKAGFTTDPDARLKQYRCENPYVQEFDFVLRVQGLGIETAANQWLSSRFERIGNGEWFRAATVLDCLDALERAVRDVGVQTEQDELRKEAARQKLAALARDVTRREVDACLSRVHARRAEFDNEFVRQHLEAIRDRLPAGDARGSRA